MTDYRFNLELNWPMKYTALFLQHSVIHNFLESALTIFTFICIFSKIVVHFNILKMSERTLLCSNKREVPIEKTELHYT